MFHCVTADAFNTLFGIILAERNKSASQFSHNHAFRVLNALRGPVGFISQVTSPRARGTQPEMNMEGNQVGNVYEVGRERRGKAEIFCF